MLICAIKYGGCGYMGDGREWQRVGGDDSDFILCPSCNDDHAFQLTDGNFESLTEGLSDETKKAVREKLDLEHMSVKGGFLKFCIENNFISKDRLTQEQKEELGIRK